MTGASSRAVLIFAACLLAARARAIAQDSVYSRIGIIAGAGVGIAGGTSNEESFLKSSGFVTGRGPLLTKAQGSMLLLAADYRFTKDFSAGIAVTSLDGRFTDVPHLYAFRNLPYPYAAVKEEHVSTGYYLFGAWYAVTTAREDYSPNVRFAGGIGLSRVATRTAFGDDWNAVWKGNDVTTIARSYIRPSLLGLVTLALPLGPACSIGAVAGYRYIPDIAVKEEAVSYPVKYPSPRTVTFTMPAHNSGYSSSLFGGYMELRL